jgi:hypothetical protein
MIPVVVLTTTVNICLCNKQVQVERIMFLHFVRFQVLTAASMKFRIVFWDVLPCKIIVPDDGGSTYL